VSCVVVAMGWARPASYSAGAALTEDEMAL